MGREGQFDRGHTLDIRNMGYPAAHGRFQPLWRFLLERKPPLKELGGCALQCLIRRFQTHSPLIGIVSGVNRQVFHVHQVAVSSCDSQQDQALLGQRDGVRRINQRVRFLDDGFGRHSKSPVLP